MKRVLSLFILFVFLAAFLGACSSGGDENAGPTTIPAQLELSIDPTTLPSVTINTPYNQTVSMTASGGTSPYLYSCTVANGSALSTSVSSTGSTTGSVVCTISGTPLSAGTVTLNFTVTDSANVSASAGPLSVNVSPAPGPTAVWQQIYSSDVVFSSLAIDPANSQVVYAGTNYGYVFKTTNGGVFKTTDGGTSWTAINTGLTCMYVNTLAIDPANSQIVYAGTGGALTGGGVFKTTDGGASWTATGLTNIYYVMSLAIDPANSQIIYAGTYSDGGNNIFKTTDGGASWTAMNTGLINTAILSLVIDPANSQIIYAGTGGALTGGRVFKTTDGGASWTAINTGFSSTAKMDTVSIVLDGIDVRALAIDPANSQVVYAGEYNRGVMKTTNGGASWTAMNTGLINTSILSLAIDPANSQIVYAGTISGVFATTNGGATWTAFNTGLSTGRVNSLAIDPANSRIVYAGTVGGVFKTVE